MSNVVLFPRHKKDTPPTTIEEIYENAVETRKEHIEYVLDDVLAFVFQRCYEEGFNLGHEDCVKTTSMIVETMRSGLYKTVGIPHPMHDLSENMFVETTVNNEVDVQDI